MEEVNIANGDAVGCTGEDDEELQQDAAGKDDDGAKAEDGAWMVTLELCCIARRYCGCCGLRARAMSAVLCCVSRRELGSCSKQISEAVRGAAMTAQSVLARLNDN